MKIDNTRYNMFLDNPERYRLREVWKIQPIEPKVGSAERKRSFGKFQGICFHEMMDGLYRGVTLGETADKLLGEGYGFNEVEGALDLAQGARDKYPDQKYLAHEASFEYKLPGGLHSIVGRIDHIFERDGEILVGDWKTSSYRSKSQLKRKGNEYCRSSQVDFYLLGARALGFEPTGFIYRLVSNGGDGVGIQTPEFRADRNKRELTNFQRSVTLVCDLIEFLKTNYDPQQPWVIRPERYPTGYESREGRPMYHGFMPEGFEPKREHLDIMRESQ